MQLANYYIEDLHPNKFFSWISIFRINPSILKRLVRVNWRTGLIVKLNKALGKIYLITEGQKNILSNLSREKALIAHPKILDNLKSSSSFYSLLERVDFLNNEETKEIIENIISNCYYLESQIRISAYSDAPPISEDNNLIRFTSNISLGTLQA